MTYTRYGIYYTPPAGDFARAGAEWLGWDIAAGRKLGTPEDALTLRPRKYGFHGTIKPPFALAAGRSLDDLERALAGLATTLSPVRMEGLAVTRMGAFLALTPQGDTGALEQVAASVVRDLDGFRAPASEAELARRRHARLSPQQEENLALWGYPFVMEAFRFHMTLTGPLPEAKIAATLASLSARFEPLAPRPFLMESLSLVGEGDGGMFHLIGRYPLGQSHHRELR